ncbi:MAG: phosphatase PAP2 family protein [Planctomycetes bacterium]|nr:phosphatase PAP2 family protein [Planctomycetota bacterium]
MLVASLAAACSTGRGTSWARPFAGSGRPDVPAAPRQAAPATSWPERVWATTVADHRAFYDGGTLFGLGTGIGLAGLSANSQLDRDIYEDVLPEWRTDEVREFRDSVLPMGEGTVVLPVLATAALAGPWLGSDAVGTWGERSLRAIAVGAPPMLALQRLIGAGRPDDPTNTRKSEWEPFDYSNGVSGHAFIGSVPFLTVARMQDDVAIDCACYAGSLLVAGARLQGSRHYFSQVVLGWWIGFLATGAVDDAGLGNPDNALSILPYATDDEVGILVSHRF